MPQWTGASEPLGKVRAGMTWMRHSLQQSECEVMTEPSTVASRPAPMTVQPSCLAPWAASGPVSEIAARTKTAVAAIPDIRCRIMMVSLAMGSD